MNSSRKEGQKHEYYSMFRNPRNKKAKIQADCKADVEEAMEYTSNVDFEPGSINKNDIKDSWDDIQMSRGYKYITKPKNRTHDRETIRKMDPEEEE